MDVVLNRLWNGSAAPDGVGGRVSLKCAKGRLLLDWSLQLPAAPRAPAGPAAFTEGLWEWDVLEVFLRAQETDEAERYVELELGPGGHWLALAFDGVRRRSAELRTLAPSVRSDVDGSCWRGHAEWDASALEAHGGPAPWSGLVTAVLGSGASRSFLTQPRLPGQKPDFHQPGAWMPLELEPQSDR